MRNSTGRCLVWLPILLVAGCGGNEATIEVPRGVETMVVAPGSADTSAIYSGPVVSRYSGSYGFRLSGMITARSVEIGQRVSQGQILARLDPRDVEVNVRSAQAQSAAAATRANAQIADLARARALLAEGFISPAEFDQTRAATAGAQAQLRSAQESQTSVQQQLSYTVLRAGRAGVVTAVSGDVGEVVAAGQPIVTVEEPGSIEVSVAIPEGEVGRFRSSSLSVRSWASPGVTYPGYIRTIAAAASPQTRTFEARIAFTAPLGAVAIGNTAEVLAEQSVSAPRYRVPLAAVTRDQGVSVVWIVSGTPAIVRPRRVEISSVQDNFVLITTGLRPGDRIASAGAHLLKAGQKVRILPSTAKADQ